MGHVYKGQGKPAVVVSDVSSPWASCRVIVPNLVQAYELAFKRRYNTFSLNAAMNEIEIWNLAAAIHKSRPDRIIFLDHYPHPGRLIRAIATHYAGRKLPPLYFHVYGDFTLYSKHWLETEPFLRGVPVRLIAASHRQQELMSRFTRPSRGLLDRCPFPVDCNVYKPSMALRSAWRQKLGIKPDEFAIVYTGRISLQKNSMLLTENVLEAIRAGLPFRLILAGDFDDIGAPFFGLRFNAGYYYQVWHRLIAQAGEIGKRVTYLGRLGAAELTGVYNAADVYASLSVHHDEDFGMSPAEALCCGAPVALSDWGGYASFSLDRNSCDLAETRIVRDSLTVDNDHFKLALRRRYFAVENFRARQERAKLYVKDLSIEAAALLIRKIHASRPPAFKGFSALLKHHSVAMQKHVPFPGGPRRGTLYQRVYGAYASR